MLKQLKYYWYRFKWNLVERFDFVPKTPYHVDIELTSQCNLKCVMCPHGTGDFTNIGQMSYRMASDVIQECAAIGVYSLKFNFRGEPALHKDLYSLISYAKTRGILETQINTNLVAFNQENLERLVKSGIDRIIISIDGDNSSDYEKIRIGAKWSKLMANLQYLNNYKERINPKLKIRIQMTEQGQSTRNFGLFKKYCDELSIKPVTIRGSAGELRSGKLKAVARKRCAQPSQRLVVAYDGTVYPCCSNWNDEYPIGNYKQNTLLELWNDYKIAHLRKINSNMRMEIEDPCKNCVVGSSYVWRQIK